MKRCERCGEILRPPFLERDDGKPFCFLCIDDYGEECSEGGKLAFWLVEDPSLVRVAQVVVV
jgi:hypothetical protein